LINQSPRLRKAKVITLAFNLYKDNLYINLFDMG
jgi:hypothetical protein